MPGARQRRRKKHRGTQAGTVRRRGRTSRPSSRAEARGSARQSRAERMSREPTWRGAINRAGLAAAVFFALLVLILKQSVLPAVSIALFMFLVYIPLGYSLDSFLYRMRQRRKDRESGSID
jgi:hypothetical protein